MMYRFLFALLAVALSACSAEPSDEDISVDDDVSSTSAALTGDALLAAAYTVRPPVSGCSNRLYAAKSNNYSEVFRTADVYLTAGETVLVEGQLRTVSSSTTNIMNGWRAYVDEPDANGNASATKTYPALNGGLANGANHVGKCGVAGDTTPCESYLAVKGAWVFTATRTGRHQFVMEARAQTTASSIAGPLSTTACPSTLPTCGGPGQSSSTLCFLAIATGSGSSFLNVWAVHAGSKGHFDECRWATGYGTATTSNSPLTVLNRTYTVPAGETAVHAASYVGLTTDNAAGSPSSSSVMTRLAMKNVATGVTTYFPSSSGQTEAITRDKHHHKAYLEGTLTGLTSGQSVQTWTDVWLASGTWVRIDTGCNPDCLMCDTNTTRQVNLSLWP